MRPELDDLVAGLAACDQLVHVERLPARVARTAELRVPLPPELARLVPSGGLWSHQAQAIETARCPKRRKRKTIGGRLLATPVTG